jgi:hypothetical protein
MGYDLTHGKNIPVPSERLFHVVRERVGYFFLAARVRRLRPEFESFWGRFSGITNRENSWS